MVYVMWCGGILALIILALIILVSMRPATFHIERSRVIAAPPETLFGLLNDFHRWSAWSPWEKMDPQLQRTYTGAESGAGAVYAWAGNKKVGEGRMTILESRPNDSVKIKLEFLKPFTATNEANFKLSPEAGGTRVTWSMDGQHNFVMKAFGMLMDMDAMIGKDFEKGLENMDAAARGQAV
jgi:uncharacterized protein YndB with AHSA1/START domain